MPAGPRRLAAKHPLASALIVQALLIPLALLLARALGLRPWAEFGVSPVLGLLALAATVPPVAALFACRALDPGWFDAIEARLRPLLDSLFGGRGRWAIVLAAALAGLGEELLFRGVLQAGLAGLTGPWAAVVTVAVVFGALHALTRAYFVLATLMGAYLGALYALSGSLLLVTLVHALYDWVALEYLLGRLRRPHRGQ